MTGAILLPNPHDGQKGVRNQARRRNWLSAGRRWRKTTMGVSIAIESALQGWPVFWGAPTYDQVRIAWQDAEYACGGNIKFLKSEMTSYFPNGGKVVFRSLDDPDNARGHSFKMGIFDEVADIKARAYYEVVSPILANYTDSIFWGIGTPKGRNWFFREWSKAGDQPDNMAWQIPTLGCKIAGDQLVRDPHQFENPEFPWKELVKEFHSLPRDVFKQEYLAQFLEFEGAVFRRIEEAAILDPSKPDTNKQYIAGVDVAAIQDYTVVTVIDVATKEMVYMDRFNRVDYPVLIDRLAAVYDRWHLQTIVIEANSIGKPVIDHMIERGLAIIPFTTTNATKQQIIQSLQSAFENGNIKIINDPILIGELLSFESKRNPSGSFSYSAPDGMHDDCLREGTLIKTDEGYKKIENIKPGDLVLTHTGNYKQVEKCIKKPFDGAFYRIKPRCGLSLDVSYNHPIYSAMRSYEGDITGDYIRRDWILPEDWLKTYRTVCVKEYPNQMLFTIDESDYYENGPQSGNIGLRSIDVDIHFASLLGRFAADGHCRKHGWYGMELAFNDKEMDDVEYYAEYLTNLGIATRVERIKQCKHAIKLVFSSKLLYHIMLETYNEYGERVLPAWYMKLGELLEYVYYGWMAADGCEIRGKMIGCSISKPLALTMRDIAISIGKYATIQELTNRKRYGKPTKDQYWVTVTDEWPYTAHQRMVSDYEYAAHAKLKRHHYSGNVYNLQVADDRSFVANGIVVHNCVMSLAIAWSGIASGPRYFLNDW